MKLSTSPEGFKKLCEIIEKQGNPPVGDDPFWAVLMPIGHMPEEIKITQAQWEETMGKEWKTK